MSHHAWTLPDGVDEVLAPDAWALEQLRRRLLDLYRAWGYAFVLPPLIEYLDALLTGAGRDLDVQTFKLTDQTSGRLMGVRADMTPQIARIDTNRLATDAPARLCYTGTVLRARATVASNARALRQIGVELFGHGGDDADREVLALMIATLRAAGIEGFHLDLGHVAVVRAVLEPADLGQDLRQAVFDVLQRKALPDLESLRPQLGDTLTDRLAVLMQLHGEPSVLAEARRVLGGIDAGIDAALDTLQATCAWLAANEPDVPVHVDLAELRGYRYHTGLVFAAFVTDHGRELARGGRYDAVGSAFGQSRAATGFSSDLNALIRLAGRPPAATTTILAPADDDPALAEEIARLRAAGDIVVRALAGAPHPHHDRHLHLASGGWQVADGELP